MEELKFFIIFFVIIAFIAGPIIILLMEEHKKSVKRLSDLKNILQQFATSDNLNLRFTLDGSSEHVSTDKTVVEGDFCDHFLSIHIKRLPESKFNAAFLLKRKKALNHFDKHLQNEEIIRRFWDTYRLFEDITFVSPLKVTLGKISTNYSGPIESKETLQSISDLLVNLFESYLKVCMIGGEAVTPLLQVKYNGGIAWQIIEGIAAQTKSRIKPKRASLLCEKCFNYCSSHKAKLNSSSSLIAAKYYGCRICRQSRDFIEGGWSMAVLDDQMTEEWSLRKNEISVNWLAFRKPFDFHEVKIVQVSDRDVEEFVMQAGNDTDEFRQPRYKEIPCIISSGCKLPANTRNLLKHTFKSVKET